MLGVFFSRIKRLSEPSRYTQAETLLWAKAFPFKYLCHSSNIAAVGIIFNIFRFDAVSGKDSNLLPFDKDTLFKNYVSIFKNILLTILLIVVLLKATNYPELFFHS